MKKYFLIVAVACITGIALTGCNKETFDNTAEEVGHSRVVFFPTITTKGERLVIIYQGGTYTDQGAVATLNEKPNPVTSSGSVDPTKPGIYAINYETKNPDGFSATDFRTVVVIGSDVPASRDYSGTYDRTGIATPQNSTWTKTATGVYTVVNPGGAVGVTATAVNYTGNLIAIPLQLTSVGPFSSTGGVYKPDATPPQYEWAIVNAGYGAQMRFFTKR